ncbi:MAG: hypothetical protein FDZ70_08415 [Actinobacteria bacterium]|nr:MAG: hypothetical protein FDZ70_08415 [Actinomycetota bacterium]
MITTVRELDKLRLLYEGDCRDMMRVFLAARSVAEADLALAGLHDVLPERTLVSLANLREVIAEVPVPPCSIRVEAPALAQISGYAKERGSYVKPVGPDGCLVFVLAEGNLLFDIVLGDGAERVFLAPQGNGEDRVNPRAVDLLMERSGLLEELVDLTVHMGLVFNPTLYLSLEDWALEHAGESLAGLQDLF